MCRAAKTVNREGGTEGVIGGGSGELLGDISYGVLLVLASALLLLSGVYVYKRLSSGLWQPGWWLRCILVQRLLKLQLLHCEVAYLAIKVGYRNLGFRFFFCGHKSKRVAMTPNDKS
jgi:hypothetical protein